jgi:Ribbon-helix-helix protein, copG family
MPCFKEVNIVLQCHMKAISVKLPAPLFHDLAQRAKDSSSTQSEIIRSALAAYLHSDAQPSTASCADRASRWIGMMQGPADLSTNAKHLEGFGE